MSGGKSLIKPMKEAKRSANERARGFVFGGEINNRF